jgi:hypothetical protein
MVSKQNKIWAIKMFQEFHICLIVSMQNHQKHYIENEIT